jgi:hypothetical protein
VRRRSARKGVRRREAAPAGERTTTTAASDEAIEAQAEDKRPISLSVTTVPPTTVYLEGRVLGKTPLQTKVSSGPLHLELRDDDLGLRAVRVVDPSGERLSVRFVFRKGILGFQVPEGVMIELDGKQLGRSPLPPLPAYEGLHEVVLISADGKRTKRQVKVARGSITWLK